MLDMVKKDELVRCVIGGIETQGSGPVGLGTDNAGFFEVVLSIQGWAFQR